MKSTCLIVVAFWLLCIPSGFPANSQTLNTDRPTAEGLRASALRCYDAHEFERALDILNKLLPSGPITQRHIMILESFMERWGDMRKQLCLSNRQFAIGHDSTSLLVTSEFSITRLIRSPRLLTWFQKAIEADPGDASAFNNLGASFSDLGRNPEAIAAYEKALRLKPDWAEAHRNLALASAPAGDYERVFNHLNIAISLRPNYSEAYNNLGVAHHQKGHYREAAAALQQAIRIDPNYEDAVFNLGLLQLAGNKRQDALAQYQKLKGLNPTLAKTLYGGIYKRMILDLRNK